MTSPQLSVRSARARDLAHELSRREKRPIHAIVEDALVGYERTHHEPDTAAAFLRRLRALAPADDQAFASLDAAIEEHRQPHHRIEL